MLNIKNKIALIILTFSIFLLFSLFFNNNAFAVTSTSMTIVDNNAGTESIFNPSNTNKSGTGWSWNKDTSTLTLNGFNGQRIEANGDFTIKLQGSNTINVTGNNAKGLYSDYGYGTIAIEKTTNDSNDKLLFNCTNVSGDDIVSALKVNINGGTININVNQTKDGLGRVYGPYCNSGTYLKNGAKLNIVMNNSYSSNSLQGIASLHCQGSGNVTCTIRGYSSSVGFGNLYIEDGSTSHVTVDVQDTNPGDSITYATESLNKISDTGTLTVVHGRVTTGWFYSSYPNIASNILITPSNGVSNYIIFPYLTNGYRAPTFLDAKTLKPIEDGLTFIPQANEIPLSVVNTTVLNLKANNVGESAVTEFSNISVSFIPSVLRGLNPNWDDKYADYEVVSGTLPPGVGVSPRYGFISGDYTDECEAGSFTVRVTRRSDNSKVDVKVNYGAVTEGEKYLTIDGGTLTETKINLTSNATGNGWTYTGLSNTLELNNYTGGPIYSEKGLDLVLRGKNTINVKKGDKGGLCTEYFKVYGELSISAIGGSSDLTINIESDCDTINDSIINANKFNFYSGKLKIIGHDIDHSVYGIYCNSGCYVQSNGDETSLYIDLSTNNNYIKGVNSLSINNQEGTTQIIVDGKNYEGVISAVDYLYVSGKNDSEINISAKTTNDSCKNYATQSINFNATKGKIVVNEGIVSTSYNYSSLFECTEKTKITTKNTSRKWILSPRKDYLNNAYIFTDSNTLDVIKDGLTIETVSNRIPFKYKYSKAFDIQKSKVGEPLRAFDGLQTINLRGGCEGIDYYNGNIKFEVVEGTLPKGITLGSPGYLEGNFEEITQPGRVKIRVTRLSDNSTQEFYLNYDIIISDDPSLAFPDVPNGKWYSDNIKYVKDHGIMSGYGDGTFGLNDSIARGQIVLMFYRLAGTPSTAGLANPFTDVPEGKYFTEAVKWAVAKEITTGKTATTFDPYGNVTRQELAVFFARYAKNILNKNIISTYNISNIADYNDLSTWARPQMQYIMEKGIITGDMALGYARILPRNNATRAMAATMFTRFCQNIAGME